MAGTATVTVMLEVVTVDLVGDLGNCEFDCPAFLERWTGWWQKQTERPVALLETGLDYRERLDAKARNMTRKADGLYTYREFDYNTQLDGIYQVNTSKPVRSGGPMTDRYLTPPEPIRKPWNTCARHGSTWCGAFAADDSLAAYCNLVILNDIGVVNTVLGHAARPAAMNGLFAYMAENAPVRFIHYLSLASSPAGLAAFKRSIGFHEVRLNGSDKPLEDMSARRRIILHSGREYPHSFGPLDLTRLEAFLSEHTKVQPLRDFAAGNHAHDVLSLRHDVDHSAEHAIRFAEWEHERGINSSYYLLPTAGYYAADAKDAAVTLETLGHEVGIHNDAMCAAAGDHLKALALLREWVEEMRSWRVAVTGCADHGGHPHSNVDLWRVHGHQPAEVGLDYEAYLLHQQQTHYISDSGGKWNGPLERRSDRPTHLLVHPEHWQLR